MSNATIDFSTFITSLSTSALLHLGIIPTPEGEELQKSLPLARQTIDILELLRDKTRGNLTEAESGLLERLLFDLRMAYVQAAGGETGPAA